ncbi:cytochrome d ubiquinol oxidase subunit II [Demequina sp. TTPB684]|uniref:cytochrome d ubiquinol oxidase subunit II n=1 Tax=unclassified Demequina TaxID=2620311 RepID=UPI001CF59944|nr:MULTISPECIES: cytochrome d ubiquinol oxidase subunit II [unclassified Demequina]MCB2412029.1 cytochrome d ubiquinol oxidase subunit II [Demequina sp. TTPB684]UPU88842.1 cytochrome d ubiquinol oxidase subunit II [Demequina sp. TMPB413]
MNLADFWFILIAVLWTGYLVLEGFDFGVGMLMPIVGKTAKGKRVLINTIGPVWDGNEVWLLTAGGATFAAFPEWYATLFSGFYLPLLLILLALIVRAVAIEYRAKINDENWRNRWTLAIVVSSWVPSILWGVAFANIVRGVPIDETFTYTGGFFNLLNPFALLGGLVTLAIFLSHGAIFLSLKTSGAVFDRAKAFAKPASLAAVVVGAVWAVWLQLAYSENAWTWGALLVAAIGLIGAAWYSRADRFGLAFTFNALAIVGAVVLIFGSLYPDVMPSTTDAAFSLTVDNARSSHTTLVVMTWVAGIFTPLVLAYQAWSYWVFRRRLSEDHMPEHNELTFTKN